MDTPLVLGFYGLSNSGKTTLLTKLISWLKSNDFNVATIKITDKAISIDSKGKDTDRFKTAGADFIVFSTSIETTMILPRQMNISDLISQIDNSSIDIILIEGAKNSDIPKIRVGKQIRLRENTLWTYDDDVEKIIDYLNKQLKKRSIKMAEHIVLKVNGKNIPLTEFPKEFIEHTIEGMISSLKGVDEIETIEITIKK